MIFTAPVFAIFFAVVLLLYLRCGHRWQNRLLLVASYVFYGWWDWRFTGLLALSTVVDYTVARRMGAASEGSRRRLLAVSVLVNLGALVAFKYLGFFVESAAGLLESLGLQANLPTLSIVLPVGISFYTFQTMAYTIDVYRGRVRATDDPVAFGVYVAYFPQLVAGPIERAQRLLPQILTVRRPTLERFYSGAFLFCIGLVRKVAVADQVAPVVNRAFADPSALTSAEVAAGAFLFGLQIYGDFAGYSDMARGVSRLLGIELVENFQHPYFARNITDFWRRWHVSLSQWLRDYLYIPLGGNRGGRARTYRNLMLTMLLGGLWHGAAWTFVVWGGLHGAGLAVHKWMVGADRSSSDRARGARSAVIRVAGWLATMLFVWIAWVFFRASGFGNAIDVFRRIVAFEGAVSWRDAYVPVLSATILCVIDLPQFLARDHCAMTRWWAPLRGAFYAVGALLVLASMSADATPFIYFQF